IGVDEHVMIAPRVYPVPARDHVVVEGPDGSQGPFSARLTDLTGTTCFKRSIPASSRAIIPLSDLSPGAYLLELTDGRGRTSRTRIIVQ
ncbi:MAG: T9SS type A sorting domain-containing protein, partial [Flavobacteriales bacterium]|nr:T9SS type A sorting domain-containing protein [Flavobacteriales bacterium]